MDYLFENLGDERFQEFCNSLISKEYQDMQSFPVGQPDGGRDSIAYRNFSRNKVKTFYVFQVKYVRNPKTIDDVHKWFTKIVKEEAPKINKLIPHGAQKYVLITNVKGTSHLNSGSIDKVTNILEENIKIPSMCWWRDDLCTKVEKDPIFKWSFPEILNGQDVLNSILFEHINENKEKRASIVKAYLADQYEMDNEVKFKQIDLRNKLFELFTDVPLRVKSFNTKDENLSNFLMHNRFHRYTPDLFESYSEEREHITAANFILSPLVQSLIPRLLLEGGPGQGKSTISQYICQIHRVRLLCKNNDIDLIPSSLKYTPIRIPIKIDLRHIASWIEQKNPYENILSNEYFNSIWSKSLESFLVGHIVYHSQNMDTTISDIIAIMKESSILLVFDGFDEIANIQIRKEVVEFINRGINRLLENSKSLQVIITSRPAAFAEASGFSIEYYPHFELIDITNKTIQNYVNKWIKASQLNHRESIEIKKLVEEKLELPHLKDLAKSPMQLAILISLLRTRGESLPNKRTALYDSYIELFFNREAEKSLMVRDNRYLIMEIHEYLAWVLHSDAELTNNNGTIHLGDLKIKLRNYLEKEGHPTALCDSLFDVLKERVCALVSRVQGTFEFEVQPLREYFCAKFLYNTAPYSPSGIEKVGTKPDRFDAIARNYYWQNVVRFFTGCFDKGELPMLVDQLKVLEEDEHLKYTNYPLLLMCQILSDSVFGQSPRMSNEIVEIIIESIKNGRIIGHIENVGNNFIVLPSDCGGRNITIACFDKLLEFPHMDYALELINIIKSNPYDILNLWLNNSNKLHSNKLTIWLEYALLIGIMKKVDSKTLFDILKSEDDLTQISKRAQILIRGERFDIIDYDQSLKEFILIESLNNKIHIWGRNLKQYSLGAFHLLFDTESLSRIVFTESNHISFINVINSNLNDFEDNPRNLKLSYENPDKVDSLINTVLKEISPLINMEISEWQKKITLWDSLVECLRTSFGEIRLAQITSIIAAGIKSKNEIYEEYSNLSDNSISLCKRVRCARMKSGNVKYWKEQLDCAQDIKFVLLVLLSWATPRTIVSLKNELDGIIQNMSSQDYQELNNLLSRIDINRNDSTKILKDLLLSQTVSDDFKFILKNRLTYDDRSEIIAFYLSLNTNKLKVFSGYYLMFLISQFIKEPSKRPLLLDKIQDTYLNCAPDTYICYPRGARNKRISLELAKKIMSTPLVYPRGLVDIAEQANLNYLNKKTVPIGEVSKTDKWFDY